MSTRRRDNEWQDEIDRALAARQHRHTKANTWQPQRNQQQHEDSDTNTDNKSNASNDNT